MNLRKIGAVALAFLMLCGVSPKTNAMENGAYLVTANTNYWNPDTGEIDDGGTANAALGEGMCRSATGTKALVEKDGDKYYVTIRLLLQSNTHSATFKKRTGYNSYSTVSYSIMAENAVADSVDYRFEVSDPFQPIKASMYVVPMGRETTWYIELDKSSMSSNTSDFVVSVKTEVVEETPVVTEPKEEVVETVVTDTQKEEVAETPVEEAEQEVEIDEEVDEEIEDETELEDEDEIEDETEIEEVEDEILDDEVDEEIIEHQDSNSAVIISLCLILVVGGVAAYFFKFKKKK